MIHKVFRFSTFTILWSTGLFLLVINILTRFPNTSQFLSHVAARLGKYRTAAYLMDMTFLSSETSVTTLSLAPLSSNIPAVLGASVVRPSTDTRVTTLASLATDERFWENVSSAHPGYRDAYIELSLIAYQQGNFAQAKRYITTALSIDPNSAEAQQIESRMRTILEK